MNGKYGPYIAYKGSNYKIPEGIVPEDLSLASCLELVKLQAEKGAGRKKRTSKTTKSTKAKTAKSEVKK